MLCNHGYRAGAMTMTEHICRRLMLFLDGTWNEDEDDISSTNIVYLRERLSWGLNTRVRRAAASNDAGAPNDDALDYKKLPAEFRKKGISGVVLDGFEYIVHYDRGVGTGPFLDAIKGGLLGDGLDLNVRQAYRFLSTWYRPGDEIFVFGFSRGAFTARSLCGYLGAVGLLRCEYATAETEERAWRYYRTAPHDRPSGEWHWFNRKNEFGHTLVHDKRYMRVRALGVFDTVGALGIPTQLFRKVNQLRYAFHDTEVSSLVDIRLHAMAIDEPRYAFAPALWTAPKFKHTVHDKSPTEQVWFAGAHSDVGGGYVAWTQPNAAGLSFLPMAWMIQRLEQLVAATAPIAEPPPFDVVLPPQRQKPVPFYQRDLFDEAGPARRKISPKYREMSSADQHEPWAPLYLAYPRNRRVINQQSFADGPTDPASGRVPHSDPICEMVHVSVLERLHKRVTTIPGYLPRRAPRPYAPENLVGIIPYLAATYIRCPDVETPWRAIVKPIFTWKEARIVDWDGRPLDPLKPEQARRAFELLPKPDEIGVGAMPEEMTYILDPRITPMESAPEENPASKTGRRTG